MVNEFDSFQLYGQLSDSHEINFLPTVLTISDACNDKIQDVGRNNFSGMNPAMLFGVMLPNNECRIVRIVSSQPPLEKVLSQTANTHMFQDMQRWYSGVRHIMYLDYGLHQVGWWIHGQTDCEKLSILRDFEIEYFLNHPWFSIDSDSDKITPPRILLKTANSGTVTHKVGFALYQFQDKYYQLKLSLA